MNVALGGVGIDVSHGGGQNGKQDLNVFALSPPSSHAFAGMVVPKIVQARLGLTVQPALFA